jgi:hypothetical protein
VELAKMPPDTIVTLIVDGEEVEMKASDAFKRLGRQVSANKRFEEAKAERVAAQREREDFRRYQSDFTAALSDPARMRAELAALGMNPRQIANELIRIEEQEAQLTPEQRKLREYEQRERQRQEQDEQGKRAQFEQERVQHREAYSAGFNAMMTKAGIPEDHVARDVLMPTLARAAQHIFREEGREMKKGEARMVIDHVLSQFGGLRQMNDEQRRASITDADYEAWQASKRAQRVQASPQAERQRDTNSGRYVPDDGPQKREPPRNVNGERMVQSLRDVWNR